MKTLGAIICGAAYTLASAISGSFPARREPGRGMNADEPAPYQVIVTEIMADPHPVRGLPDAEYIELYNRGESGISLAGCRLVLGRTEKMLPHINLDPKEYLIICDAEDESLFIAMGKTAAIGKLPAVVNTGQAITLKTGSGKIIFSVEFSDRWFQTVDKADGGWSLEMIDTENFCGRDNNWCESTNTRGGTPGTMNSVSGSRPDRQKPVLLRASLNSDSTVLLQFNESMDSISLCNPAFYSANRGLLQPVRVDPVEPAYTSVSLEFGPPLNRGIIYTITTMNNLKDCAGNPIASNAYASFGIPESPDSLDVILNEVLFDVPSSVSEFIELYNRSDKIIDLSEFSIALFNQLTDSVLRKTPLKGSSFQLLPDRYAAITRWKDHLPGEKTRPDPSNVLEQPLLFILPDAEGEIALLGDSSSIIDKFHYSGQMHSEFFGNTDGISLERVSASQATNEAGNWCSAASASGYSTPGYKNSQYISSDRECENVNVNPGVFSPDADGTDDIVVLTVDPGGPGFMASIRVFDSRGIMVKTLASHVLMGTGTILTWDGICDDQSLADIGIYLIYIELFDQNGIIKKFRKVVTLARRH